MVVSVFPLNCWLVGWLVGWLWRHTFHISFC